MSTFEALWGETTVLLKNTNIEKILMTNLQSA